MTERPPYSEYTIELAHEIVGVLWSRKRSALARGIHPRDYRIHWYEMCDLLAGPGGEVPRSTFDKAEGYVRQELQGTLVNDEPVMVCAGIGSEGGYWQALDWADFQEYCVRSHAHTGTRHGTHIHGLVSATTVYGIGELQTQVVEPYENKLLPVFAEIAEGIASAHNGQRPRN